MTPFGQRCRQLRASKGISQKEMAAALRVSAAYVSALERGHRGAPPFSYVQRVIAYFNVIWDEAEELQRLSLISHPRAIVDTTGLCVEATEFANLLARHANTLGRSDYLAMTETIKQRTDQQN